MTTERLVLPFPPSVNGYWRSIVRGKGEKAYAAQILSERARVYKGLVMATIGFRHPARRHTGKLRVTIELWAPTEARRDVDNYPKAINDALTAAGVWEDDFQIDDLRVIRKKVTKGGRAVVTIEGIE